MRAAGDSYDENKNKPPLRPERGAKKGGRKGGV